MLVATLLVAIAAAPGGGVDLVLCLGQNGHAHMVGSVSHDAALEPIHEETCTPEVDVEDRTCTDVLLCSKDDAFLKDGAGQKDFIAIPATTLALLPVQASTQEATQRIPSPDIATSVWIGHRKTIIIIV